MIEYSKSNIYYCHGLSCLLSSRAIPAGKRGAGVYKYEKGDYTPQDDVAIVLGTGFPDFCGSALKYTYDFGIDNMICRLESHAERFGERFRLCKFL